MLIFMREIVESPEDAGATLPLFAATVILPLSAPKPWASPHLAFLPVLSPLQSLL